MVHKKTINQKHNIRKQAQTTQTRHQPPTNNQSQRRTELRFYAEMVTDITTQNSERKDT